MTVDQIVLTVAAWCFGPGFIWAGMYLYAEWKDEIDKEWGKRDDE